MGIMAGISTTNLLITGFMVGVGIVFGLIGWLFMERGRVSALQDRKLLYVRAMGSEVNTSDLKAELRRRQVDKKLKALTERQRYGRSRLGSVKAKITQAGLEISITRWWMTCIIIGLISSVTWNIMGTQPLATPVVFLIMTFVVPRMWLSKKATKRQLRFTKEFPNAVDIMVRGLSAGMPIQESIRTVSTEIPEPVGPEFRIVMDQVNAGLPLPAALERAFDRMPTQELRFFATVIAVQEQNGGSLAEILSKISEVLRSRSQLKEKAKALSGEARMSAIIVGALPFLVSVVLFFANREYLSLLWTTSMGNYFLVGAIFMMFMGVFIMNKMGDLEM